jgi:hypothetical protein
MIKTHPFDDTMIGLFGKLESALKMRQEAEIQITANSAAIRALANACEDEEFKGVYLLRLEELTGKPGFKSVILTMLKKHPEGMTPRTIAGGIRLLKLMDLSGYSNPLASIHTTLRRMKEAGEVDEILIEGEKAYRISRISALKAEAFGPPKKK